MLNGSLRRFGPPFNRSAMAMLGIIVVLAGILGMHMLTSSHGSPGQDGQTMSAVTAADGMSYQVGGQPAAASSAGPEVSPDEAAPSGHFGGGNAVMDALCLISVVVVGVLALLVARRLNLSGSAIWREPAISVALARSIPCPPSLVQLSISRT